MTIVLPWPPSVNTYWRHNRGRTHISNEGVKFRENVALEVKKRFGKSQPLSGSLELTIEAFPPTRGRHDLDNLCKAVLDALASHVDRKLGLLTHTGVYLDDSQIDDLRVIRRGVVPGGKIVVTIGDIDD